MRSCRSEPARGRRPGPGARPSPGGARRHGRAGGSPRSRRRGAGRVQRHRRGAGWPAARGPRSLPSGGRRRTLQPALAFGYCSARAAARRLKLVLASFEGHIGPQPRQHLQEPEVTRRAAPGTRRRTARCPRDPELGRRPRHVEARGHDTDHAPGRAVHVEDAAHHGGVGAERRVQRPWLITTTRSPPA